MTPAHRRTGWPLWAATCSTVVLLGACATAPVPSPATAPGTPQAQAPAPARHAVPKPGELSPPAVADAALRPQSPAPSVATPSPVAGGPAEPVRAVDTLNPDKRINPDDLAAQQDLWARLRRGYAMPVLDNDLVRKWEQYYGGKPEYMQRMTERGGRYLYHVVEEVEKRGLPLELALLPFIESAFNPQAMSHARASGMWQFIPSTGRHFQLKQNVFRDDRRDVLASTQAALTYLQKLHGMFNDWQLALAAYNWGEGSVSRAIAKAQRNGLAPTYENLDMPAETRNYVPKLQAVRNIVLQPAQFGVTLPALANHPYFLSVPIANDIDVAVAAKLAELSVDEFRQLNPQMNKPVILAAGTPQVLLPYDNATTFARNLSRHRGAQATWTAWVVPRTMKSAEAARQVGMAEPQFREVNRIPPRMLVKAGSTLLVPRGERRVADVQEEVADNATLALAPDVPPLKTIRVKVGRKGSSVAAIARQYKMSPATVASLNRTSAGASLRPGQWVAVQVPNRPAARLAKAGRSAKAVVLAKAGKAAKAGGVVRVAARPAAAAGPAKKAPARGNAKVRVASAR